MKEQSYERDFYEEAYEQLVIAEQALLSYEETALLDFIEEGYRALHTFKGAVYMFDFKLIGDFAHQLETIFDLVFHHEIADISNQLGEIYGFIDHLKVLLSNAKNLNEQLKAEHAQLKLRIEEVVSLIQSKVQLTDGETLKQTAKPTTYFIQIKPSIKIVKGEFHPVFNILEELDLEGELKVIEDYDPTDEETGTFHTWYLFFYTSLENADIQAAFIFIDDEVEVLIHDIIEENILESDAFKDLFLQIEQNVKQFDYQVVVDKLLSIAKQFAVPKAKLEGKELLGDLSIRVASSKIDQLMDVVSELVTTQASLALYANQSFDPQIKEITENVERQVQRLQDVSFSLSLIPLKTMINGLKRMVRDVSESLEKKINFHVQGDSVELDKSIIELLSDSLMHVLKNCIDHGIESAEERLAKGKTAEGNVYFKAFTQGSDAIIEIKDDGAGLDEQAILQKAKEKQLIDEDAILSESEIHQLIFASGFSTTSQVSNISGRGIGMNVVHENVKNLHGELFLTSERDVGTIFTFQLPVTLSIADVMLFKIGNIDFAIPLADISMCYQLHQDQIVYSASDLITLNKKQLPFLDLHEAFDADVVYPEFVTFLLLESEKQQLVIRVDAIEGELNAVLKPLDVFYKQHEFIANTTILGDGKVGLVLDTQKLLNYRKLKLQI